MTLVDPRCNLGKYLVFLSEHWVQTLKSICQHIDVAHQLKLLLVEVLLLLFEFQLSSFKGSDLCQLADVLSVDLSLLL